MKVSIITVCYNSEKHLRSAIESVLKQDYQDIEYIIVDGGSTDGTLKIIDDYSKQENGKLRSISEKDNGIYDAINKGILMATGDIIGLIHSDDFLASDDIIRKIVAKFKEDNCDALYGNLLFVSPDDVSKVTRIWRSTPYPFEGHQKGWQAPHPTFYVKKEIYQKAGIYPTHYKISADYYMMLKIFEKMKARVSFLDEVMVKMRVGGTSTRNLKSNLTIMRECSMAWGELGIKKPFLFNFLRLVRKMSQLLPVCKS